MVSPLVLSCSISRKRANDSILFSYYVPQFIIFLLENTGVRKIENETLRHDHYGVRKEGERGSRVQREVCR